MADQIRDNTTLSRFELDAEGHIAFTEYTRAPGVMTLRHTEVPNELEGRGIGSRLARGVLDLMRTQKLRVIPRCPFLRGYIDRHPEYADLVA